MIAMVADKASSFFFDATVDKFDGGIYTLGESFKVRGTSAEPGYLSILYLDGKGNISQLCPPPQTVITVKAKEAFEMGPYRTAGAVGTHCVKVFVTKRPLSFTGAYESNQGQGGQGQVQQGRPFQWTPDQQQQTQDFVARYVQQKPDGSKQADMKQVIGPFAQDDVLFYVGTAAKKRKNK